MGSAKIFEGHTDECRWYPSTRKFDCVGDCPSLIVLCAHPHFKRLPDEGGKEIVCPYRTQGCECMRAWEPTINVRQCLVCGQVIRTPANYSRGK